MPRAARSPAADSQPTIECFSVGRHVAMSGAAITFAQSDLAATAGAYDPARHEAPIVIGHPKLDAPAFGWVGAVRLAGGSLEATPRKVDPVFAEAVRTGSYGKVSAAFFAPDSPSNPVPGVYYLRHVGFLGATPPAVKGLRDPSAAVTDPAAAYAELEPGVVVFSEWDDVANAGLWRSLREWFLTKWGADEADRVIPQYQVQALEQSAQQELAEARSEAGAGVAASQSPTFAQTEHDTVTLAEQAAYEAEIARLRQQVADNAAAARTARLDIARAGAVAFADGLVASRQLPIAYRDLSVEVEMAFANQVEVTGAALEFGEGDARAPLLPAWRQLLGRLPVTVSAGRLATQGVAAGGAVPLVAFAAPDGAQVSQDSLALHGRVKAHQAAHPGTDYDTALGAVLASQA